jgi:hypothetical protein
MVGIVLLVLVLLGSALWNYPVATEIVVEKKVTTDIRNYKAIYVIGIGLPPDGSVAYMNNSISFVLREKGLKEVYTIEESDLVIDGNCSFGWCVPFVDRNPEVHCSTVRKASITLTDRKTGKIIGAVNYKSGIKKDHSDFVKTMFERTIPGF